MPATLKGLAEATPVVAWALERSIYLPPDKISKLGYEALSAVANDLSLYKTALEFVALSGEARQTFPGMPTYPYPTTPLSAKSPGWSMQQQTLAVSYTPLAALLTTIPFAGTEFPRMVGHAFLTAIEKGSDGMVQAMAPIAMQYLATAHQLFGTPVPTIPKTSGVGACCSACAHGNKCESDCPEQPRTNGRKRRR